MADLGAVGTLDPYPARAGRSLNPYVTQPKSVLESALANAGALSQAGPGYLRCIVAGGAFGARDPLLLSFADPAVFTTHRLRSGRDDEVGNPAPPSQVQGRWGTYTSLVPVAPGARVISIDVLIVDPDGSDLALQAPHPRLTVRANHEVGLLADLVADAVGQTGWQTLSVGFTATSVGVVEVWREKRYKGMDDVVYWDNLRVT